MLTSTPILAHYDPRKTAIIAADASNCGIGAVLLQVQDDGTRKPVCYISRSLNDAEKNYAVIEKEALATTLACEIFNDCFGPGLRSGNRPQTIGSTPQHYRAA